MSSALDNPVPPDREEDLATPTEPPRLRRAGGLSSLGKGTMPPVFTALLTLMAVDVFLLLLLP